MVRSGEIRLVVWFATHDWNVFLTHFNSRWNSVLNEYKVFKFVMCPIHDLESELRDFLCQSQ